MNQNEDLKHSVEIENAINLLIREGHLLVTKLIKDENPYYMVVATSKLGRVYNSLTNKTEPRQSAINKPEEKISLKQFKEKAEIPWRVTTNKGTAKEFSYNTGQISREAEIYFNKHVVGKINMDILIERTKAYYKDEKMTRPTLTNYFLNDLWEDVYKNYQPKESIEVKNQSFTGERRL